MKKGGVDLLFYYFLCIGCFVGKKFVTVHLLVISIVLKDIKCEL